MGRAAYYAVARGHRPGVYATWDECQREVIGYPAAKFKKFDTVVEAERFAGVKAYLPPPGTAGGWEPQARPKAGPSGAGPSRGGPSVKLPRLKGGAIAPVKEGADGFCRTSDGRLVVYTDGGCVGNGKKAAKAGLGVYWGARSGRNLSEPVPGPVQTNNRGELLAILRALETAPEPQGPLEIRTDSKYCIDCMITWLPGWRRKNFKNSAGQDVLNLDLILHIERLLIARAVGAPSLSTIALRDVTAEPEIGDVTFLWVKGHVGEDGNTMADRLASAGCARPTPRNGPLYGVEEQLYLHGRRSSASKVRPLAASAATTSSKVEAIAPAVATTSSYFKAPSSSLETSSSRPAASSSTARSKRKAADKHASSHSEDGYDSDEVQCIEPPAQKKARTTGTNDDDFDALDTSWLLAVGLEDIPKH